MLATGEGQITETDADLIQGSVQHWASHMFAPPVYEAFTEQVRAAHERLHEEIDALLSAEPSSALLVTVTVSAADTTVNCDRHALYRSLPAATEQGHWHAGWWLHRHDDGTIGTEAGQSLTCNVLAALAGYGGTVTVCTLPSAGPGSAETTTSPVQWWCVEPVGAGLPVADRPTLLGIFDDREPDPVDAMPDLAGAGPLVRALAGTLVDAPVSTDGWQESDPAGFIDTAGNAVTRLARHARLAHPLARMAVLDQIGKRTGNDSPGETISWPEAVASAAHLLLRGEMTLRDAAEAVLSEPNAEAAEFADDVAGLITAFWQMHLGGYLLLPRRSDDQQKAGRNRLVNLAIEALGHA